MHKYLFENWENPEKDRFVVEQELTEQGLLSYKTYLEIETYEDLINATDLLIDFLNYEEKWNKDNDKVINIWWHKEDGEYIVPIGKIYFIKNGNMILPYNGLFQTESEIREQAIKRFLEIEKIN